MRSDLLSSAMCGVVAGVLALAAIPQDPSAGFDSLHHRFEVSRLQAHFDSVDAELRHAGARRLTPDQGKVRATLVGWLRDYRAAGVFPQNDRFPDKAMPFFRDSRGVLCAMAYLIDRSGRGDLVERVASTRNNAFIPDLANDPDVRSWLDSAGLSVEEAARIQPTYGPVPEVPEDEAVSADYALTSIAVSGASLATIGLNLIAPTKATGWAGVIAGAAAVIAGAANFDGTDGTEKVATVNLIAGSASIAAGLYRLISPPSNLQANGLSGRSTASNEGVSIGPAIMRAPGGPRLGLAMHAGF